MYETTCRRVVNLCFAVRLQSHVKVPVLFRKLPAVYAYAVAMPWLPGTSFQLSPITMNKHPCVVPRVRCVHQQMAICIDSSRWRLATCHQRIYLGQLQPDPVDGLMAMAIIQT